MVTRTFAMQKKKHAYDLFVLFACCFFGFIFIITKLSISLGRLDYTTVRNYGPIYEGENGDSK
jgi:hypothetical protein